MLSTLKLKQVYLPLALGLSLLIAFGTIQASRSSLNTNASQEVEVGDTQNAEEPTVKINGQAVDLGDDGQGSFSTGGANVNVNGSSTHVTSGGGRTVIENDDGTVNIHVDSVSNGGTSRSKVRYNGDSEYSYQEESSIEVEAGADADISVSN